MSIGRTCFPAIFAAVLLAASAQAARLESAGGLRLELSDRGRVMEMAIGATRLPLKGTGGLAVADFKCQPAPVNLVPNPGFEEGTKGWHFIKGQTLDTSIARSGKASARLEVPGPAPAESNLEVFVPVKPNTRYRVGMWMRREHVGVCGAYCSERDAQGRLSGKQTQVGISIPKRDSQWLPLSWEIATEPKTVRLSLRANIYRSTGTLWLDDYFVEELNEGVYDPVEGEVTPAGDALKLTAALPARKLVIEALFRPWRDCLRIDGQLRDTSGEDRAVGLKFALPLDLTGWTWHHDAEDRETIAAGAAVYRRTYRCQTGIGVCSVYPWSAASGPTAGLSLALPLSTGPRVFLLQHDQNRMETSLTFFFGVAKDAGHHPSRASFSLVLYPHAPAWGMRSAMETYYRVFPESFVKRPAFEGYLNYADMEQFDGATHRLVAARDALDDASDFGEGYKYLWHLHGCYDFRQVPDDDRKLPSDEKVFSLLREMAATEKPKARGYTPTAETIKKIAFGPEGTIAYIGDTRYWRAHEGYNHTDKPGWGLNFRVNEDPGMSSYLAETARAKAEDYARSPGRRPWDATFTADAIEGYFANSSGPDYRRDHFRTTLVPLTFGRENLRPCMPNTIWDFHEKAWWPITGQYKIATYGNANGYEQFFTMPFVDVPMTEGDWDPKNPGRIDRFMRAVNYQKIWRYWHAWDRAGGYGDRDPENVRRQFRRGLAYAIYPPLACVQSASGDLEPHRALYRQYVPAIEELSTAGWEPVPYAAAGEGLVVERFGQFGHGELHFTLRNYAQRTVETVLVPDRRALGIPAGAEPVAIDIVPRAPRVIACPSQGLRVALVSEGSAAFWIGTRRQAAQHAFRLAAATLKKIDRIFAAEMDPASTAVWKEALQRAEAGSNADDSAALRLAEELQQGVAKLENVLTTHAPVDRAKLFFRLRTDVSLVPAALLHLDSQAPRVIAEALKGETAIATWRCVARQPVDLQRRVVSPWPELAARSAVAADEARLWVPADPPRRLLPYLLETRGKIGGEPFTLAVPVDVQIAEPLTVTLAPERVFRGGIARLTLKITNRLTAAGRVKVVFTAPKLVNIEPANLSLDLPERAAAEIPIVITLDKNVPIGDLRILYAVIAEDRRLETRGPIFLTVGDRSP